MLRLKIIILAFCVVMTCGVSVWWLMPITQKSRIIESPPATSQADRDRQNQAKEFFRARQDYDLKGGQEMRPRW